MGPSLRLRLIVLLALGVFASPAAWAIGTVTDGGVTFGYTVDFATSRGDTVNTDFTGAAAGDQLFESWWFFRVAGDGRETAFGIPDLEDYTLNGGSVGRLTWTDPGGAGLFDARLGFEVIETGAGQGVVFQNLTVFNTSLSVLDIDIFHYTDLDLSGSFNDDNAALVANPDGIEMAISDGASTAPFIGYGADAYQVTRYRTLLNRLTNNGVTNLNDSGLPFGGGGGDDFTGAFQWSSSIGVGSRESFLVQFGSDSPLLDPSLSQVPEPGPAVLMALGLAGLASLRRRED